MFWFDVNVNVLIHQYVKANLAMFTGASNGDVYICHPDSQSSSTK